MKKVLVLFLCCTLVGCVNKNTALVGTEHDIVTPEYSSPKSTSPEDKPNDNHIIIDGDSYLDANMSFGEAMNILQSTVMLGDDRLFGFVENNIKQKDKVIYTVKEKVSWGTEQIESIKKQNPSVIIVSFGLYDLLNSNANRYAKDLKTLIEKLQKEMPEVPIICTSILKPNSKAIKEDRKLSKYDDFNDKAKIKLSSLNNVFYLDINGIVKEEHYKSDGVHFLEDFYKEWTIKLAEYIKDKQ